MNRRPLRFVALAYAAVVLWVTVGPRRGARAATSSRAAS